MKATFRFRPKASSPFSVEYPWVRICPFTTRSPFRTIGFKVIEVLWLVFRYFGSLYTVTSGSNETNFSSSVRSYLIWISVESEWTISPSRSATTWVRLSPTTAPSKPVPTIGASDRNNGTACRIMFEPINARFASSCSKNGINEAAIDAIWFGATSINWTWSGVTTGKSPSNLALICSSVKVPSGATFASACAITSPSSSSAL